GPREDHAALVRPPLVAPPAVEARAGGAASTAVPALAARAGGWLLGEPSDHDLRELPVELDAGVPPHVADVAQVVLAEGHDERVLHRSELGPASELLETI